MDPGIPEIAWPEGKAFAFTIVDDTDCSTCENVGPIYDFLWERGFRTTKTVWPLEPLGRGFTGGSSLADDRYREFVMGLKERGFEIALHGAADETSPRERVIQGLDRFRAVIGCDPSIHANHLEQAEAMYWGDARLDPPLRWLYQLAWTVAGRTFHAFGHVEGHPLFWGDLCRDRIAFVRNFAFNEINTLKADPLMPYHDPARPWVRFWFSSSNGQLLANLCELLHEENQDRLVAEHGACIAYTHFGSDFVQDGQIAPTFRRLMDRLAGLNGWFVPATTLLRYIGERRGWRDVSAYHGEYRRLQRRWLFERLMHRGST